LSFAAITNFLFIKKYLTYLNENRQIQ